ncbi:MAG: arginine--tRNA ligase [Thermoplasmata archaeon]|nr:arginine--tRNA ligase [Thermoplasmata archaeon]
MEILSIFRDEAERLLRNAGYPGKVEQAREEFGDFTFPCFSLAKERKMNPALIAKDVVRNMEKSEYFEKIENVGAYVNFTINPKKLAEITLSSIIQGEIFKFEEKGKVIVEHTSANPTGPLHVGRTRNSIIGDTVARILRRFGYDVEVQYFVNDVGKQVATLLWGVKNLRVEEEGEREDYRYVKYYQAAYEELEKRPEIEKEVQEIIWKYERGDQELRNLAEKYVGGIMRGIAESLKRINVEFDEFVWESSLVERSRKIPPMIKEYLKEENGAYYIDLKKLGVEEKDKLFLYRSDGTTLYPLRDIAYHLYKAEKARYNIDVLGEDHKLHFQAIKRIIGLLKPDTRLDALFYSFVKLPEGKMSTRKGRVVYLDDLVEEGMKRVEEIIRKRGYSEEEKKKITKMVAVGAIRFHILNVQEEKPITFKWENALNFEGESGPFIQYTHARAESIMKKTSWDRSFNSQYISHPQEIKLVKLMARYPEIIKEAAMKLTPYVVAKYAYSLASQFNQFYRDCPVIKAESGIREFRLALVYSFKALIKDLLELLGIEAPEKM